MRAGCRTGFARIGATLHQESAFMMTTRFPVPASSRSATRSVQYRLTILVSGATACVSLLLLASASSLAAQQSAVPTWGPEKGALVIVGGGRNGPDIMKRFMELAGGSRARIVVLPGAGDQDTFPADWSGLRSWREAGAAEVTVLHTRDPKIADSEAFVRPLKTATAVWIPGGRQWKLTDVYLGTRTLRELHAVLARGGVIGGSSAGASVQASYMVRGAVEGNAIMMAPGHEQGFGFLRGAAVDQHILVRGRQNDLQEVIAAHPDLMGVGLDESTAIVVQGNRVEVIGESLAAFHNAADRGAQRYYFLEPGSVFDLGARQTVSGNRLPPEAGDRRMVLGTLARFFAGMQAGDTAALRRVLHADARIVIATPAGQQSAAQSMAIDEYLKSISAAAGHMDGNIADPDVRVDGNLANVWAKYELSQNGSGRQCGTGSFQLARIGQTGWRILQAAWTKNPACN
jgi:cyanophycinase